MYKVFISVRNRLAMTTKCIYALKKHSVIPHQIYVYDNLTTYRVPEHFMYFSMLYERGLISQVTFTSKESTFNAFSKASSCNFFGSQHEHDPNKDSYDFLLFLDNDIIVTPGFDEILVKAWRDVKTLKMNNIKIIGQLPGGIKVKNELDKPIGGLKASSGVLGGSGFWSVRPNFFRDVGYLDLKFLVDLNKKHDIEYWAKISQSTGGNDYILGLKHKLCIHCGKFANSICNTLTRNRLTPESEKEKLIRFEDSEKKIDSMTFDEFYKIVYDDPDLNKDW
jgi:hypothetical protein